MTIEAGSDEEAVAFLDFLTRFESDHARRAFVFLHLAFCRFDGCSASIGRHGVMESLRIHDQGAWSYAFAPARFWVTAWVRPPEYRKGRVNLAALSEVSADARDRGDAHFVVRLHDIAEARRFHAVIADSRGD